MKFHSQIQLKNNSQVQESRRQNLIFGDVKNISQLKTGSGIFMSNPSEVTQDSHRQCQNGSNDFKRGSQFSLDQFEMQFDDRSLIGKLGAKIPQSMTTTLTDNRNPTQDYSTINSHFGQGFHQIPVSHNSPPDPYQKQLLFYPNQENQPQSKRDVFGTPSPFVPFTSDIPDTNDALDQAFLNCHQTQIGKSIHPPSTINSIYQMAEKQNHSTPEQKAALGDDAKSSMSMRVDDEPTATTHKLSGGSTKYKTANNMTGVDVLDSEDMSFDLIMQNSVVTNHQQTTLNR